MVETFGGGIWWREIVEALMEALVEGYMVEGFSGGINGGRVGEGIWWREMVEALVERYG